MRLGFWHVPVQQRPLRALYGQVQSANFDGGIGSACAANMVVHHDSRRCARVAGQGYNQGDKPAKPEQQQPESVPEDDADHFRVVAGQRDASREQGSCAEHGQEYAKYDADSGGHESFRQMDWFGAWAFQRQASGVAKPINRPIRLSLPLLDAFYSPDTVLRPGMLIVVRKAILPVGACNASGFRLRM